MPTHPKMYSGLPWCSIQFVRSYCIVQANSQYFDDARGAWDYARGTWDYARGTWDYAHDDTRGTWDYAHDGRQ